MSDQADFKELCKKLDTLIQMLEKPKTQPLYGVKGDEVTLLSADNVVYAIKEGSWQLYTPNGFYRVKLSEEELKKSLGGSFVYADERIMVNLKKVKKFAKISRFRWNQIVLIMGEDIEIPVARAYSGPIEKTLGL